MLKDQIITLFEDDTMRKNMGLEGRKFIEENYDWSNIVEKSEDILLKLNNN